MTYVGVDSEAQPAILLPNSSGRYFTHSHFCSAAHDACAEHAVCAKACAISTTNSSWQTTTPSGRPQNSLFDVYTHGARFCLDAVHLLA